MGGECVVDTARYMSPDGDDDAAGTRDAPWRTFTHSLSGLGAGDTLILHDGTYGEDFGTGHADIDCGDTATACNGRPCPHGTPDRPITVRALHERMAFVRSNGVDRAVSLRECRGWTLDGLRAEYGDFDVPDTVGIPVRIDGSEDVVLRRLLVAKPSRWGNVSAIEIGGSSRVLVEECEVLDFHLAGITVWSSSAVVVRRSYLNPRDWADLPETGRVTRCPLTGDTGVSAYYANSGIVENTISEGACRGFENETGELTGGDTGIADDSIYAGNVAMDAQEGGFVITSACTATAPCASPNQWAAGNRYVDDVAIDSGIGFWFRGGQDNVIERCTALDSATTGVRFDEQGETVPLAFPSSAYAVNTLIAGAGDGFVVLDQAAWNIDYGVARVDGEPYSPDDANVTNRQNLDPELGTCRVALPPTSPLRGAGLDGADIGATIDDRYENGVLTATPLWLDDGAFPCGAVVPGVNDTPGASCTDVHLRLNVGPGGCPVR